MSSPSISLILVFSKSNMALSFWYVSLVSKSLILARPSWWNTFVRSLFRISSNCSLEYFDILTLTPNILFMFSFSCELVSFFLKSLVFIILVPKRIVNFIYLNLKSFSKSLTMIFFCCSRLDLAILHLVNMISALSIFFDFMLFSPSILCNSSSNNACP